MRTRLKVCCIGSVAEAEVAVGLGADALGLVAEMPSGPGVIADATIAEVAAWAPAGVSTFLLTSRTEPEAVVAHVLATGVNTVQLVDAVQPETYAALRRGAPGVKIVQVLHVQDEDVLEQAKAVEGEVHAVLLDSGRPSAAVKELGGTGRTHNWQLSARVVAASCTPVFLAGGITPANVEQAIRVVRPFGIDLCSGVRSAGILDPGKLRELTLAMRRADDAA